MALIFLLVGGLEVHAEGDTLPVLSEKTIQLKSLVTRNQVLVITERIVLVELISKEEYDNRLAEQAAQKAERSGVLAVPSMRIPKKMN